LNFLIIALIILLAEDVQVMFKITIISAPQAIVFSFPISLNPDAVTLMFGAMTSAIYLKY